MTHPLLGSGFTTTEDGHVVSAKIARIAEILMDYNPEIKVYWIEPLRRTDPEDHAKPFMLVHEPPGQEPYTIAKLGDEEMNEQVLARIFAMDYAKNGRVSAADKIEAISRAGALYRAKEWEDKKAEAKDIMKSAMQSPLHKWTGPRGLVVRG
jgi:hypothetical protein